MRARRTYLITASSGIGAETARQLAGLHADFYLVGSGEAEGAALVEALQLLGARAHFQQGDLTDPSIAPIAVAQCVARYGRIDALFNVAGISGRKFGDGPIHECTEEGWEITLRTNATTQYRMSRDVVRVMLAQSPGAGGERGVILNMGSILGVDTDAKHFSTVAYAASKGAVIAMSRSMAACYAASGVRVNVVAPGLVRTPMSARASADPAILAYMQFRQPLLKDLIPAEDIAATCVYLLTDASRAMTGQVIQVDAGWGIA